MNLILSLYSNIEHGRVKIRRSKMAETRSPRNVTLIIGYINGSEKAGSGPVMPISNSFRGSTTESSSSPCYSVEINCATRAHSNNEQGGKSARKRSKTSRIISLQPWLPRRRLSTRCSFSRGTQKKKKKKEKKGRPVSKTRNKSK